MYSRTLVSISLMALALIAASNPLPEGDLVKKELKQFNARDTIDDRANRPRPSPRPSKYAILFLRFAHHVDVLSVLTGPLCTPARPPLLAARVRLPSKHAAPYVYHGIDLT